MLALSLLYHSAQSQVTCTIAPKSTSLCFADGVNGHRLLNDDIFSNLPDLNYETCATYCYGLKLPIAGVEFGAECHCGSSYAYAKQPVASSKCSMECTGETNETCGDTNALQILSFTCTGTPLPNWKGCATKLARSFPYCDASLSIDQRVDALLANLTLDETITMISPQPKLGEACGDHTGGKSSIGLPPYFWLTETNTAVAARCIPSEKWKCPTTFIGPMGMGSSFNRTSWRAKGIVFGKELRAFNNLAWTRHASGDLVGLTGFGPNINIARDPRFGRSSELPGEDPFHLGTYASEMVQGMQTKNTNGMPLMLAYLKHFTAYSRETNRGHDTYNISQYDLFDSYLAQYEIAFKEGHASGVMCSYDSINGIPSCANDFTLNEVLRKRWNQTNAFVTTDCGAVSNMRGAPANAPSDEHAAAWTINNGTDLEMGSTIWTNSMKQAIQLGLVTEATVRTSARRGLRQLFTAGRFDSAERLGAWAKLGLESINSTESQAVAWEAALQGMVLLKNNIIDIVGSPVAARQAAPRAAVPMLPLMAGAHTIAVVGAMATSVDLMSDYAGGTGESGCWPNSDESCIVTIGEAIKLTNAKAGGTTTIEQGVDVDSARTSGIAAAKASALKADVVVLVVGNDRTIEHEGKDRTLTTLPGLQTLFAKEILALNKPTILVMSNGGALAVDNLVEGCAAIIETFNPSQWTKALAALIFGDENRWGKMPVTNYPESYNTKQAMANYDMSKAPGRSYKYYTGKPLWEFGTGLSYTTFDVKCAKKREVSTMKSSSTGTVTTTIDCVVTNTGGRSGDDVIFAFHSAGAAIRAKVKDLHPAPIKSLIAFERVSLDAGKSTTVSFVIARKQLLMTNASGDRVLYEGQRSIMFSDGAGASSEVIIQV